MPLERRATNITDVRRQLRAGVPFCVYEYVSHRPYLHGPPIDAAQPWPRFVQQARLVCQLVLVLPRRIYPYAFEWLGETCQWRRVGERGICLYRLLKMNEFQYECQALRLRAASCDVPTIPHCHLPAQGTSRSKATTLAGAFHLERD